MFKFNFSRLFVLALAAIPVAALAASPVLAQDLGADGDSLRREITNLNEKYELLKELISAIRTIIGFVSLAGVVVWGKGELHAQQAISTINELYELSLRAAQQALGASLQQAKDWLDDIDGRAREFLKGKNDRDIVRTHVARANCRNLWRSTSIPEVHPPSLGGRRWRNKGKTKGEGCPAPPLTPRCYFVLGLGENLNQDYGAAIETWERERRKKRRRVRASRRTPSSAPFVRTGLAWLTIIWETTKRPKKTSKRQ